MERSISRLSKDQLFLSIVIIGHNEENNLPRLFKSLPCRHDIEWIYVDSQSEDNSMNIALKAGAKVFLVDRQSVYSASTGRYIGTNEAAGRWILYLDGDMVLSEKFIAFIKKIKNNETDLPGEIAGFTGRTCNVYQGNKGEVIAKRDYVVLPKNAMGSIDYWGKTANYHAGAVLYKRNVVLEAGNWNPSVYQLEEVDLYSRVRRMGYLMKAIDIPMVKHYTPYLSNYDKLKIAFLPRWGNKRLHGAGQVVAANAQSGLLINFIRCYPYPFIVFAGLASAPLLFIVSPYLPLFINAAIFSWIGFKNRWYYYLVYLGNILQIIRGLGKYNPALPRYERVNTYQN